MEYIIPTWLILVIVGSLAMSAIILGAVVFIMLSLWRRKGSQHGNQ